MKYTIILLIFAFAACTSQETKTLSSLFQHHLRRATYVSSFPNLQFSFPFFLLSHSLFPLPHSFACNLFTVDISTSASSIAYLQCPFLSFTFPIHYYSLRLALSSSLNHPLSLLFPLTLSLSPSLLPRFTILPLSRSLFLPATSALRYFPSSSPSSLCILQSLLPSPQHQVPGVGRRKEGLKDAQKTMANYVFSYECEKRRQNGERQGECKAKIRVKGQEVVRRANEHSHGPEHSRGEVQKLRSEIRERAAKTEEAP